MLFSEQQQKFSNEILRLNNEILKSEDKEPLQRSLNDIRNQFTKVKLEYLDQNKPCNIGDKIELVQENGNKIFGIALDFEIRNDKVFVSRIKKIKTGARIYILNPYKELRVLSGVKC